MKVKYMKAIRIILASIRKADKNFNLINDNDRICIGVSGGKDSMSLLYALSLYKQYSHKNFTIFPCIIDLGFPSFKSDLISEFCKSINLDLEILDGKTVFQILSKQQELQKTQHLPCSICSKMKKAIINKYANRVGCNKVSFAHHKTDAIETLFLNEIYGGRIATFSPKMFLENEKITFIRPFIYIDEQIIIKLIKEENIPFVKSNCPNDGHTERQTIKETLLDLYKKFPTAKDNFLIMLENRKKEDIFYNSIEKQINNKNLFYKEIFTIDDYIKESEFFLKSHVKASSFLNSKVKTTDLIHVDYYKNNKLVGFINYQQKDRNFKIVKYKYLNIKDFKEFLFIFYKEIYLNFNPCELEISSKEINFLQDLGFKHKINDQYLLVSNPASIEKNLRNNKK